MAEEKPKDERTEAPTAHRKQQAREKGDNLTSKELATAMAGMAGAIWLWSFGPEFVRNLQESLTNALSFNQSQLVRWDLQARITQLVFPTLWGLGLLALLAVIAAIASQASTAGLRFVPDNLAPKFARLNPVSGLGRIFGIKGLIELGKSLLKVSLLGVIFWWVFRPLMPQLAGLSAQPAQMAIAATGAMALKLVLALILGLAAIGAIDLPLQLYQWLQRLRMTKQDIKDEYKQQEGSPEIKHALRRLARESLKNANRGAMAEATVVLTNPTHFAVALRYRPDIDDAPIIVARGRGVVAAAIRELASENETPILSYPSVTRALYFTGKVGAPIRTDLYQAVATILAFVLRVGLPNSLPPDAEAPESARFDANGRKQS